MEAPRTLADLIQQVRSEDQVTLEAIAVRAGLPLSTIGAWATGTRGARRAPDESSLKKLAKGLRRPEEIVFEAAGRVHPSRVSSEEAEGLYIARLYGDLSERDREVVRQMLLSLRKSAG